MDPTVARSAGRVAAALWTLMLATAGAKVAAAAWGVWFGVSGSSLGPRLPVAVVLTVYGAAGALLIVGGLRDRRVHFLGALFLLIAAAFANPLMPGAVDAGVVAWTVNMLRRLPVDAFLPVTLWLFVREFPSLPTAPIAKRVADGFITASVCVGTVLFAANAWPEPIDAPRPLVALLHFLDRDVPTLGYWPLLFTIAVIALPYLVWRLRFETVEAKQRGAMFIIALVVGTAPILLTVIATPFVAALRDPGRRLLIGWILYGALVSLIPSTAYAVVVNRVMDVHLILRKTSQHTLARYVVWIASVVPLTYLLYKIYSRGGGLEAALEREGQPFLLIVLPLIGFAVLIFRDRLLKHVDRWFLRGAVDYAEALARVERGLHGARSIRESAQVLTHEIDRSLHPMKTVVSIVDAERRQLEAVEGVCRPLSMHSVLVDMLRQVRSEILFEPQADGPIVRLLPPHDREWLLENQLSLVSPLLESGDRLVGIIAIGESRGGLPYTRQDRMLITAMTRLAAVQLENRRLQIFAAAGQTRQRRASTIDWDAEAGAHCPACGAMWAGNVPTCTCQTPTVPAMVPPVVNGKFRVLRLLGSGGMGVVYLAVDLTLDRKVAVKALPKVTPDRVALLQREARAMASVHHPNLAMIYGAEQWRGTPLLIVEYLEGGTLSDYLRRGGALDLAEAVDLAIVLADVLVRVHASGVLHRDIKPSNIAYTRDGVAKLLDFGVAAIIDHTMSDAAAAADARPLAEIFEHSHPLHTLATSTQRVLGTPLYLSPEAVDGRAPQPSFDLWSLGLVIFETVAARHPFAGGTVGDIIRRIHQTDAPDVRDFRPECPPDLAALVRDCLSRVLARRPATAADLRTRLQRVRATFPRPG